MGGPSDKTRDRRVERTRRLLREAMISLLLERGWEGFGVQDVCDRADVGRSTFYTHFADKEELLAGGFADLRQRLQADLAAATPQAGGRLRFSRGLIEHAEEHQRLFRALVGKRSGQIVLRRFRELVVDLVREDLTSLPAPAPVAEARVHFLAGAFMDLLSWWLETRTSLTAEELERLFLRMARSALEVASK